MVLLLMSVLLVPLLGKLYCEFALPLMSVDLVPRVGGVGHQHFFRTTWDDNDDDNDDDDGDDDNDDDGGDDDGGDNSESPTATRKSPTCDMEIILNAARAPTRW